MDWSISRYRASISQNSRVIFESLVSWWLDDGFVVCRVHPFLMRCGLDETMTKDNDAGRHANLRWISGKRRVPWRLTTSCSFIQSRKPKSQMLVPVKNE